MSRRERVARWIAPAVVALAAAAIVACSDAPPAGDGAAPTTAEATAPAAAVDWPIFRGDAALRGVASGRVPDAPALLWTFPTGGAIASSAVVRDGRVFVGSDDGHLYAVDLATGEKAWSFLTEDIVEAPPLVAEGTVYVGSSDFYFYALDAETGALRWRFETDDKILGAANTHRADDGTLRILVGSYDNRLYCLDAATGDVIWTYETEHYINGAPAVVGDRVVFGGCDAALHVVSAVDGTPRSRVELGEECQVAASAAIADGHAYLGHHGNAFVCIDIETGAERWRYTNPRYGFFSSPAIGESRVVFGGRDKHLHCARRDDGSAIWTFPTRRKVDGSPVICGDRVVFGSGDGRLYIVDLADGSEVWSYDIGQSIFSSPAVAGGIILIGSNDGRLYAFGDAPESS
jgi:outer membrane protein assembly factor BamB